LPEAGVAGAYANLSCILTRSIDWELIEQQYDEMVRYGTALIERTADPETILRRFTRGNVQHPTYRALGELGKAMKTVFLCRYLRDERLRREIHEGLNVVETWNSANGFIFFGRSGEVAGSRVADQQPRSRPSTCSSRASSTSTRSCSSACWRNPPGGHA
jgi:TnpA family transposase